MPLELSTAADRPVILNYRTIAEYLSAVIEWRKRSGDGFSIRKACASTGGISSGLVTLVASGKRKLTRDRVPAFARVLGLNREEASYLDGWVAAERTPKTTAVSAAALRRPRKRGAPENHLLAHWLNLYVKDLAELKGFSPDPLVIHRMLGGIATPEQIERSLNFLLKHGFLRRTLDGRVVKNTALTMTTDDVPSEKIRQFHKRALGIAQRALDLYPVQQRRASAVTMALNHSSLKELNELLKDFHERLLNFIDDHEGEGEALYQVLINLSPVGGSCEG